MVTGRELHFDRDIGWRPASSCSGVHYYAGDQRIVIGPTLQIKTQDLGDSTLGSLVFYSKYIAQLSIQLEVIDEFSP
jgi:hypothetical protein